MGMTDSQFVAFRRQELKDFKAILAMIKKIQPEDSELVQRVEELVELAKSDTGA
ncbi:hypothetical protein FACS1894133_7120 [Clostridia bacterium]|nr:hypothetical protein FACS1894133_7120 [Clostridia bacterium]